MEKQQYFWALLRLGIGWIFFWAFIDKLFGLGFATQPEKAWIHGGSPTLGFLTYATKGPFAGFYQSLAGSTIVDWLFMLGLLFIGLALLLGVGVRIAAYSGTLMFLLMYTAVLLPENNPLIDDHIVYSLVLMGLSFVKSGRYLGLGKWWSKTRIVRKHPFLK